MTQIAHISKYNKTGSKTRQTIRQRYSYCVSDQKNKLKIKMILFSSFLSLPYLIIFALNLLYEASVVIPPNEIEILKKIAAEMTKIIISCGGYRFLKF